MFYGGAKFFTADILCSNMMALPFYSLLPAELSKCEAKINIFI